MVFELNSQVSTDRRAGVPAGPLTDAIGATVDGTRRLFQPSAIRDALQRAEPFLPAIVEAAGAGIAGQLAVQAVVALARRALDDADKRTEDSADS
jgi:hypothetical protein